MSETNFKVGWNHNCVQQYIIVRPVALQLRHERHTLTISYRGYLVLQILFCTDESIIILDISKYYNKPSCFSGHIFNLQILNVWLSHHALYTHYLSVRFFNSCRRLPETKRHSSLFLHWSGSKFLDVVAACTPIHVFLGRPLFLLSRGIQSIINFGILPSGILLTWPYHCSLFCSMISGFPFTPIISFIYSFFILSILDYLADLLSTSISVDNILFL